VSTPDPDPYHILTQYLSPTRNQRTQDQFTPSQINSPAFIYQTSDNEQNPTSETVVQVQCTTTATSPNNTSSIPHVFTSAADGDIYTGAQYLPVPPSLVETSDESPFLPPAPKKTKSSESTTQVRIFLFLFLTLSPADATAHYYTFCIN